MASFLDPPIANSRNPKKEAQKLIDFLASPEIFFYTALWMIILLVFGTVDQKYVGLYIAQHKYFSSWFVWGIFPGGRMAMTVMFVNLLFKLVFKSPLCWNRFGTLVTHSGMLLLLLGGFFTAYFSKEGAVTIPEGETISYFDDFHDLEIAVIDKSPIDHDAITVFRNEYMEEDAVLSDPEIPFTITVETFYRNAGLKQQTGTVTENLQGVAKRFELVEEELKLEHEANRAGMYVTLEGLGDETNGRYIILQRMSIPQVITVRGRHYVIELRNKRYQLPFSIELIDFKQRLHPGTSIPAHFSSLVNVVSGGFKREFLISMNEPLRYMDYTFYQYKFFQQTTDEGTVLQVVQNAGRNYPYISSCIMAVGLFIHLVIQVPKLIAARSQRGPEAVN